MTENDHELLGQFTREQSQDAFSALVNRHLNLVYTAALRQVRSPELAEEISLSAFTQLARRAGKLTPDTVVTAWLYKVACNSAIDVIRREARRQAREQIAFQMSALNEPSAEWTQIESMLDEVMQSLDDADRTAILLRYFENKSLREVGESFGISEDAAQKRVSRALDQLRELISKRQVAVGAAALAALVSANAVQSAPAGLAATISSAAILGAGAISSSSAVTITKAIAMTTFQKSLTALVIAGAVAVGIYQAHQASMLRADLRQQREQQAALTKQIQALEQARDRASNSVAMLSAENAALKKHPTEVIKLRGEVGQLKEKNAQLGSVSAISKATADPASRKLMRDAQKMGMGMIYKDLAKRINLTPDQTDKLNDLLADHIMANVDNVTKMLRDKSTPAQMDQIFNAQEAALQQQIQELLGPDALAQYQDYSKNLLGTMTADQFEAKMTGTDAEKKAKVAQLAQLIDEQSQALLSADGLPADYQTVPILNFRNIASEQTADKGLQMLSDIYQRAATSASSFLSPDELAQFQDFQKLAIDNSRAGITLNRNMMSPISQ